MFNGIRFVLIGFDSVSESQYRQELVTGGGVDVGQYDSHCTHVIVHGRVYDDPVCIAARRDGKMLVTELWVEDSLDIGNIADASRILYRPVKDLKGIPGAESLHICLTGYQKHDRDDIMKMVDLMGAQFSKPLIASKVTHLICYKFEGEKYELAKKIGKTLVNHRWLEDCLKAWEILPGDNYRKSSWELELMEAEARDSEEETEPDVGGLSNLNGGSGTLIHSSELPTPVRQVPIIQQGMAGEKGSPYITDDISKRNNRLSPCKEINPDKASDLGDLDDKGLEELGHMGVGSHGSAASAKISQDASLPGFRSVELNKDKTRSSAYSRTTKKSPYSEASSSSVIYSRKIPMKSESLSTELSNHQSSPVQVGEKAAVGIRNLPQLTSEQAVPVRTAEKFQILLFSAEKHHEEDQSDLLPQKRKATVLSTPPSSLNKGGKSAKTAHKSPGVDPTSMMVDAPPSNSGSFNSVDKIDTVNQLTNQLVEPLKTTSPSIMKQSGKNVLPVSRTTEFKNLCSPLDSSKVTSLPCHAQPSHKLDKQTTRSDITDCRVTSAAGTDTMKTLDLDAAVINGRRAVDSFMKEKMPEMSSGTKVNNRDTKLIRLPNPPVSENSVTQKSPQDGEVPSPNRKADDPENRGTSRSSLHTGWTKSTSSGKLCKKLLAKKRVASKPKASISNTNEANDASHVDKTITSNEANKSRDGAELVNAVSDDNTEMPVELASRESDIAIEDKRHSVNRTDVETVAMDGEILMDVQNEKNLDAGSNSVVPDAVREEGTRRSVNKTKSKFSGMNKKEAFMDVKKEKRPVMDKSISIPSMKAKVKRIQNSMTKISEASAVDEKDTSMDLEKVRSLTEAESTSKASGVIMEKLKGVRQPLNKTMCKTSAVDNKERSMDAEKENRPTENGALSVKRRGNQEVALQSIKKSLNNEVAGGTDLGALQSSGGSIAVNCEPVWFILSGHRLQRKEFQLVIRCLRGRLCRDSHQWSYQATHYIVPDPVRRTEKFFAAAAAGRWILKTDYLTASNQAGRFLAEEPFEWYKRGLSEDGAISLEASRKWRLLRERTGHGAFYGMRVLIYGECVAPSLDTLKRVVKAGDGTILATSPPYSRFMKSGVDFAVIGPGILHVDCWVQEFLKHEIPCIAADYLVDYVCKPGFSLEIHVLYNTHDWAEKSLTNLISRSEEIVQTLTSSIHDEDVACVVCGSRERGDVMLICGDEGGSLGCGIGTHIDCCDPPLEAVPNEDWFCPKCRISKTSPIKRTKKASSKKCK